MRAIAFLVSLFVLSSVASAQITQPEQPTLSTQEGRWSIVKETGISGFVPEISRVNDRTCYVSIGRLLLRSDDAGLTWRELPPTPGGLVHFLDEQNALITTWADSGKIQKSTDGGMTWHQIKNNGGEGGRPGKMTFPSHDTGFTAGLSSIMRTIDGGENWFVWNIGVYLRDIHFFDSKIGFAVGDPLQFEPNGPFSGEFMRTTDGGDTGALSWESINVGLPYGFSSVRALSEKVIVIASDYGHVFRSTDAGNSWEETYNGLGLLALSFADSNIGYAVGDKGAILRTTTGGKTWMKEDSPISSVLYGVHAISDSIAIAVGENGTILRRSGIPSEVTTAKFDAGLTVTVISDKGIDQLTLNFSLNTNAPVTVKITSLGGLYSQVGPTMMGPGPQSLSVDTKSLASGAYLIEVQAGAAKGSAKVTITR